MRVVWASVSLIALFYGALETCEARDPHHFRWRLRLLDSVQSGVLYRAELPMAVLDGCKAFPADLLFIDDAGRRWPFFIQPYQPGDPLASLPFARVEPPEGEPPREGGVESIYIDARFKSVPLRRLVAQAAEAKFDSQIKVFGRDSHTNAWIWVSEGVIHRHPGSERDWLDLHNRAFRFLRVDISNLERGPLTITNLALLVEPMHMVFEAASDGRAWLYFGTSVHGLPLFDLRHRTSGREIAAASTAAFGHREPNPLYYSAELWDYGQLLLATFASIIAVLALGFILKQLR
jgi:hypothetical protein